MRFDLYKLENSITVSVDRTAIVCVQSKPMTTIPRRLNLNTIYSKFFK